MKLMMLGILTVLLVATLAAPAAAATTLLAPGAFIADVIRPSNGAICGRVIVSQTGIGSIVFSVDFTETSYTGCNAAPAGTISNPARFDLCRVDRTPTLLIIKTIEDTNANGKIDGLEGILKGVLASGDTALYFDLYDSNDRSCTGNVLFRTGYKRP